MSSLFIYLLIVRLLPYLGIINNVAAKIGVHASFQASFWFLSGIYPGVELLGNMVVLRLCTWG